MSLDGVLSACTCSDRVKERSISPESNASGAAKTRRSSPRTTAVFVERRACDWIKPLDGFLRWITSAVHEWIRYSELNAGMDLSSPVPSASSPRVEEEEEEWDQLVRFASNNRLDSCINLWKLCQTDMSRCGAPVVLREEQYGDAAAPASAFSSSLLSQRGGPALLLLSIIWGQQMGESEQLCPSQINLL